MNSLHSTPMKSLLTGQEVNMKSCGDSQQKMRSLYNKWNNIEQNSEEQNKRKNQLICEKIESIQHYIDSVDKHNKCNKVQKHIIKLYDEINQEDQNRTSYDKANHLWLSQLKSHLEDSMIHIKHQLGEIQIQLDTKQTQLVNQYTRTIDYNRNTIDYNRNTIDYNRNNRDYNRNNRDYNRNSNEVEQEKWKKHKEKVKRIERLVMEGVEELNTEEKSRIYNQRQLVEGMQDKVEEFIENITIQQQIRYQVEDKIISMIEAHKHNLQQLLDQETQERNNSHNTLLTLLEDTCLKIDMAIKQ